MRSQIFFAALMSSTPKCWNVGSPFGTRGFNLIDNYMLRCGDQVCKKLWMHALRI